jgi:hypothetical protein
LRIQANELLMLMADSLLVALAFASVVSVGLLFLPSIVELKKPRDNGPRLIIDVVRQDYAGIEKTVLSKIEDDYL